MEHSVPVVRNMISLYIFKGDLGMISSRVCGNANIVSEIPLPNSSQLHVFSLLHRKYQILNTNKI